MCIRDRPKGYLRPLGASLIDSAQDMLLAGNDCVTDDEATTQFVIWSIVAAPLIMGNVASCVLPSTCVGHIGNH